MIARRVKLWSGMVVLCSSRLRSTKEYNGVISENFLDRWRNHRRAPFKPKGAAPDCRLVDTICAMRRSKLVGKMPALTIIATETNHYRKRPGRAPSVLPTPAPALLPRALKKPDGREALARTLRSCDGMPSVRPRRLESTP